MADSPTLLSAIQLRTNRAQRALRGVRRRDICDTSSKRIEGGGLSVPLSPEEIVEGVAGSATSTVYTITATLL